VLVDDGGDAVDAETVAAVSRSGFAPPVVVVQATGDVAAAVALMRAGAFDVLADPSDEAVAETVQLALRESERRGRRLERRAASRQRFERLTGREHEVLALVVAGHANKLVAQHLGISPRTVENHRARIMEKTGAQSVAELVAHARRAGLVP